jgi:N-acetylmuramic acid 6-phosphate etherase
MKTETLSPRSLGIDTWAPHEILEALHEGQMAAVAAVRAALPALAAAADAAVPRLKRGGRLVYAGAGTSGRLGMQDGVELTPTFDWPSDRIVWLIAGGPQALVRAVEGAEDDRAAGAADTDAAGVGPDDVLIAIAASGTTPYTIAALERGRQRGALGIAMASNPDAPLLAAAEIAVLLDTGPELIAGSTRMKAGTAQKAALNLLSTLIMVRLGRVHDGHMVDMQATNAKLRVRARKMVVQITGCTPDAADAALNATAGRVKPAVLVVARGLDPAGATAALDRAEGSLRRALAG